VQAVGNLRFPTSRTHSRIGSDKRQSAVFPVVHTPYYSYEVFLLND
jgi:hypothetical protein